MVPPSRVAEFSKNDEYVTVSPSQAWEDHYREILHGNKFLNTVQVDDTVDVTDGGGQLEVTESPLYMNITECNGRSDR